jgi:hypothetical protein
MRGTSGAESANWYGPFRRQAGAWTSDRGPSVRAHLADALCTAATRSVNGRSHLPSTNIPETVWRLRMQTDRSVTESISKEARL